MPLSSKEWHAKYYVEHKGHILNQQKRVRIERRHAINFIKSAPCFDCGDAYPPYVMDFDHVRGTKVKNVSRMIVETVPFTRIMEEISKCDLVCANCHRERTHIRKTETT